MSQFASSLFVEHTNLFCRPSEGVKECCLTCLDTIDLILISDYLISNAHCSLWVLEGFLGLRNKSPLVLADAHSALIRLFFLTCDLTEDQIHDLQCVRLRFGSFSHPLFIHLVLIGLLTFTSYTVSSYTISSYMPSYTIFYTMSVYTVFLHSIFLHSVFIHCLFLHRLFLTVSSFTQQKRVPLMELSSANSTPSLIFALPSRAPTSNASTKNVCNTCCHT